MIKMINVFELTRSLVDIESTSGNEGEVGRYLGDLLLQVALRSGGRVESMPVEDQRSNVFACWGEPIVTLSTHMDTVPPFFPSREDQDHVWGRGSCDAKGIIASMIAAAEILASEGTRNFGLLFVVGEERDSTGAMAASGTPRGSRYLVNGEPTENRLALGSKGALRLELTARGKAAHSAYPELGESAIELLLDALQAVRQIALPEDPLLGRSTMNIGTIRGGQAPNVVADYALAEILVRLTGDAEPVRVAFANALSTGVQLRELLCIPPMHFEALEGFQTSVVSYTTDAPILSSTWGSPLLIGPGSIHVAHTTEERISKNEVTDAVEIYARIVRQLLARSRDEQERDRQSNMEASTQ
jgi:acetylornithine deacetylase